MRVLLHLRIQESGVGDLPSTIQQNFKVLDAKVVDNSRGEPMFMGTVILAESTGANSRIEIERVISQFFTSTRLHSLRDAFFGGALILDSVTLDDVEALTISDALCAVLGQLKLGLQVFRRTLVPSDFG